MPIPRKGGEGEDDDDDMKGFVDPEDLFLSVFKMVLVSNWPR